MYPTELNVNGWKPYRFDEPEPEAPLPVSRPLINGLGLLDESVKRFDQKKGFWKRQFNEQITKGQKKFDWVFGVILPVVCFAFDPIVFKSSFGPNDGLLTDIRVFACTLSFSAIMSTMAWLLWGKRLIWLNSFLAGLLAVSSAAAFVIGIIIFPYSLMGLVFLIGLLGFTPLFTSFVYLRNSTRAFRAARTVVERETVVNSFLLGALCAAVIPYVLNLW